MGQIRPKRITPQVAYSERLSDSLIRNFKPAAARRQLPESCSLATTLVVRLATSWTEECFTMGSAITLAARDADPGS
jgi:hypothetical protein